MQIDANLRIPSKSIEKKNKLRQKTPFDAKRGRESSSSTFVVILVHREACFGFAYSYSSSSSRRAGWSRNAIACDVLFRNSSRVTKTRAPSLGTTSDGLGLSAIRKRPWVI
jgi:hypothetical protein